MHGAKSSTARPRQKNHYEKIHVDDLKIGMYVRQLDIPWEQSSFIFQGIDIKTPKDIEDVQRQSVFVWVDYRDVDTGTTAKIIETSPPVVEESLEDLQEHYHRVRTFHEQTSETVKRLFEEVANKEAINPADVQQAVNASIDSIMRSPDAAIWMTRLNDQDNQLAQHSMNVATLCILLGQAIGFSRPALEELGVCALMHDIGMILLPAKVRHKTDEATRETRRTHVTTGFNIISESKNFSFETARSVLHHHEQVDGRGYPSGLTGETIPLNARIVAIANAYDHLLAGEKGHAPRSQFDAINSLYRDRGVQFDENLVIKFIEVMGLYPPGTIVEMSNGEVGLVLASTVKRLKPMVLLVLDPMKNAITQRIIDLSTLCKDDDKTPYQIKTTLPDGAYGIYLQDIERTGFKLG